MSALEEVKKTMLALPVEQRGLPAGSPLGSLPPLGEELSEANEMVEVEWRERDMESGRVQPVNEAEFWRRVEAQRLRLTL